MLMLAPLSVAALLFSPPAYVPPVIARGSLLVASAIEATDACAVAQRERYFALMPSRELPTVSFDTRMLRAKDRDGYEAGVFARQEGRVDEWKNIGSVAASAPDAFNSAIAAQRPLIARWAYEACNDFETNQLLMCPDEPIELAWATQPAKLSFFEVLQGKQQEEPIFTVVPPTAEDGSGEGCTVDGLGEGLRCGFLGVPAREYRGGGVSARYERIVIGQEPEVPLRDKSQEKYNKKYAYYKKSKRGQNKGQIIV